MRRTPLLTALLALLATAAVATPARATDPARVRIGLQRITAGLTSPVAVVQPNDGSGRLFVVEQPGRLRVVTRAGQLLATPYLDIRDHVASGGERGMLGLAFHPNFRTNGYLFVSYTDAEGDLRVSRFGANPVRNAVNPLTEQVFMDIRHRDNANHNGGNIAFGSDGYLYVGTGDGGGAGDVNGNAQNISSPLGKILRVDINRAATATRRYSIPGTNPFIHDPRGLDEVFHYGLRNPWRWSFDRQWQNLFIADVGQSNAEEVDWIPHGTKGVNFGWDCREGRTDTTGLYGGSYCLGRSFVGPVWEYAHTNNRCSVTGGFVYRGARYSSLLNGVYIYADYCSGEFWGLARNSGVWSNALLFDYDGSPSSFGQDMAGELYVVDLGGSLYRITAARR